VYFSQLSIRIVPSVLYVCRCCQKEHFYIPGNECRNRIVHEKVAAQCSRQDGGGVLNAWRKCLREGQERGRRTAQRTLTVESPMLSWKAAVVVLSSAPRVKTKYQIRPVSWSVNIYVLLLFFFTYLSLQIHLSVCRLWQWCTLHRGLDLSVLFLFCTIM